MPPHPDLSGLDNSPLSVRPPIYDHTPSVLDDGDLSSTLAPTPLSTGGSDQSQSASDTGSAAAVDSPSTSTSVAASSSSVSTSLLTATATATATQMNGNGHHLGNIAYLAPLFLFLLATVAVLLMLCVRRRARRKVLRSQDMPSPPDPAYTKGVWTQVDTDDEDDMPRLQVTYPSPQTHGRGTEQGYTGPGIELAHRRSPPLLAAQAGQLKTARDRSWQQHWESARGRLVQGWGSKASAMNELGRRTIRAVPRSGAASYQTLVDLHDLNHLGPSDTYTETPRSARHSQSQSHSHSRDGVSELKDGPPSCLSPKSTHARQREILSPPMQPHLFFGSKESISRLAAVRHAKMPTVSDVASLSAQSDVTLRASIRTPRTAPANKGMEEEEESGTVRIRDGPPRGRGRVEKGHMRMPTVPSTADRLAEMAMKPVSGRRNKPDRGLAPKDGRHAEQKDETATKGKGWPDSHRQHARPGRPSIQTSDRPSAPALDGGQTAEFSAEGLRSTQAVPRLRPERGPSNRPAEAQRLRAERKEQKGHRSKKGEKDRAARAQLQGILTASWGDRALLSPHIPVVDTRPQARASTMMADPAWREVMPSPGVEDAARRVEGGIEQRLAKLQGIDL